VLTIGLFGGTFDPFHNGHLALAETIYSQLQLKEIHLIPARQPLLREPPIATPEQRVQMAELVAEDYSWLKVADLEIQRNGPSYTIDTVKTLRQTMPKAALCFIMSADQFVQFDRWHLWGKIPDYVHLIVATRPGYPLILNTSLQTLVEQRQTDQQELLHKQTAGLIFFQAIPPLAISGTTIRAKLEVGEDIQDLVPAKVWEYIYKEELYTK
jgi:nicotinate-nucleotide adenylyltransferase